MERDAASHTAGKRAGRGGGAGPSRVRVLRSEPPIAWRVTGVDPHDGTVEVHTVGTAAGPLGGDHVRVGIQVGPGAALRVRGVAASVALPGRGGAPSRTEIWVTVAEGGSLEWLPEPLVAAQGCRHDSSVHIRLAADAFLVWRDELVCGRFGEESGHLRLSIDVHRAGRPLYAHELTVGPGTGSSPGGGPAGPDVLGGARAAGSLLMVDPAWETSSPPEPRLLGPDAALMPLAGPAVLASVVAEDALTVRSLLDSVFPGA